MVEQFPNATVVNMEGKWSVRYERQIGDVTYYGPYRTKRDATDMLRRLRITAPFLFDWSGNDPDTVAAIERLRSEIDN